MQPKSGKRSQTPTPSPRRQSPSSLRIISPSASLHLALEHLSAPFSHIATQCSPSLAHGLFYPFLAIHLVITKPYITPDLSQLIVLAQLFDIELAYTAEFVVELSCERRIAQREVVIDLSNKRVGELDVDALLKSKPSIEVRAGWHEELLLW